MCKVQDTLANAQEYCLVVEEKQGNSALPLPCHSRVELRVTPFKEARVWRKRAVLAFPALFSMTALQRDFSHTFCNSATAKEALVGQET